MGLRTVIASLRDLVLIDRHPSSYFFEDFLGNTLLKDFVQPLFSDATHINQVPILAGSTVTCAFRVPTAGKLVTVSVIGATTLATSDTNYVTFSLTNKLRSGSGAVVLLAATAANTTKATGGSAWTGFVSRTLTMTTTDADLVVGVGDVLVFTVTVTGTLANTVDRPEIRLQFEEIPGALRARSSMAAGDLGPYVTPIITSQLGEILLRPQSVITATNEPRMDWNNRNFLNASKGLRFRCRVKVSGASANQNVVWGVQGNSGSTPHDSVPLNAWFRIEGSSLALLAETDDAVTDRDDQATGITLVADVYHDYEIDFANLSAVKFKFDGTLVQTLSMAGLAANTPLQPVFSFEKLSGTQVDDCTVDWVELTTSSR